MNPLNPNKLLHGKWTAVRPRNKEKHFLVTAVRCDEAGIPRTCILEAVYSRRESELDWRALKDPGQWQTGWL
jgi:tryptophan-rich hypothetical protein